MDERLTYTTRANYAAAAMLALGAELIAISKCPDGKHAFHFKEDAAGTVRNLERGYWERTLPPVQPAVLIDSMIHVRNLMHGRYSL
jgi:hypothetical protein